MKRLFIISVSCVILLGLTILTILNIPQKTNSNLNKKIIEFINSNPDNCKIKVEDITNFKWDKMVIFEVGSSNIEISKVLGIKYKDSTDLMSGIVFVYKNKIIYSERQPYNPERPNKLQYLVKYHLGEPNYKLLTPDNAVLQGNRENIDGIYYYSVKPINN